MSAPKPAYVQGEPADEEFREVHYAGDITAAAVPDRILGCDEAGRPYRILDAFYDEESDTTTIVLTYARPEDVTRWQDEATTQVGAYRRVRAFFAGAVALLLITGLVGCTGQSTTSPAPAPAVTAGQLTDRDFAQLWHAQAATRPRRTSHARPRRTPVASFPRRRSDPTAAQWSRLRWCESGRDNSWHPWSRSAGRGYYQFLRGTWASVGGHGDPAAASYAEQTWRAVLLFRREGWQPWAASSACTGLR